MSCDKPKTTVRVSGVDQNETVATASFTSDAIEFKSNTYWNLNVWFDIAFSVTGQQPTVTIQVSNDEDSESFNDLQGAIEVDVPEVFFSEMSTWKFMRIVYTANGTTAGLKNFDLIIGK